MNSDNSVNIYMPVRVIFPDGKPGIRQASVTKPRLIGNKVVANAEIEGRSVRVVLDEELGEYCPCDEKLREIDLRVKSTSRVKHRTERGAMRFI